MKKLLLLLMFVGIFVAGTSAQTCAALLNNEYVSDGQFYTTQICASETKNCEITFIEGNEYRIVACPQSASKVEMQIVDMQGNVLFDNRKYGYTNYWNFVVKHTYPCQVRLTLPRGEVDCDEVVLLVGFKK